LADEQTQEYIAANRRLWNEWTRIHEKSAMYDVEGFRAGKRRLHPLEIGEVGDVSGKSLLHLQCHFGLDTMSWADRGAVVTGVDFSDEAIQLAMSLSEELRIPARFILSDLYALPERLNPEREQFDIVFTSYGALYWLPDIWRWAEIAAAYVKPDGVLYVAEFHPYFQVFDDDASADALKVRYPYFHASEPELYPVQGSYADGNAAVNEPFEYGWSHPIGDIVTAVSQAGLRIEFLHEHDFTVEKLMPLVEMQPDGVFRLKDGVRSVPLLFSLKASKPG
jgi:SAM-dependent methyltransferase